MNILELHILLINSNARNISQSIKITTAVLLITLIMFFLSLICHTENIYLQSTFLFLKGLTFSGMFLAYFHLKSLYIDYKIEKKHLASLKINHTLILQEKVDLHAQRENNNE